MKALLSLTLALSLTACAKDSSEDSGNFSIQDFTGGNFQVTSTGVSDNCMDGAFSLIFMPEGADTPNDWGTTTEFPAYDSMPATYSIELQSPFSEMEVTVSENNGQLAVGDAAQSDVLLDNETWPDCRVDMAIEAELMVHSDDHLIGSAVLTTGSFDEDNCPEVTSEPCEILLDLSAQRVE